jgi:Protein of unknown function (DUF2846)
MNRMRTTLFIALLALTACASGPAYKDVSGSFAAVAASEGRIFFYRTATAGAAIQPAVYLNGEKVGSAVPDGFFYVDRPPGDYEVTTTTELKKSLTFHLDAGQVRYVKLGLSMGLLAGHVYPELMDESVGKHDLEGTKSVSK